MISNIVQGSATHKASRSNFDITNTSNHLHPGVISYQVKMYVYTKGEIKLLYFTS